MQVKLLFVTFNLNLSENLLTDVKFLDDSVILKANPNRFLVFDTPYTTALLRILDTGPAQQHQWSRTQHHGRYWCSQWTVSLSVLTAEDSSTQWDFHRGVRPRCEQLRLWWQCSWLDCVTAVGRTQPFLTCNSCNNSCSNATNLHYNKCLLKLLHNYSLCNQSAFCVHQTFGAGISTVGSNVPLDTV